MSSNAYWSETSQHTKQYLNKHNYELQRTALGIQTEESDDCDKEIMYGPVMFYKLHGKFKTVTVNDVYLKINF